MLEVCDFEFLKKLPDDTHALFIPHMTLVLIINPNLRKMQPALVKSYMVVLKELCKIISFVKIYSITLNCKCLWFAFFPQRARLGLLSLWENYDVVLLKNLLKVCFNAFSGGRQHPFKWWSLLVDLEHEGIGMLISLGSEHIFSWLEKENQEGLRHAQLHFMPLSFQRKEIYFSLE